MEPSSFEDQIFSDFSGPLSPLNNKNLQTNNTHSIHIMLGMPQNSQQSDMCPQRLPEVHSILPGSPKIDHYKNMDYSNKIDYSNGIKIESYSPNSKMDYVNGKLEQYSPKMDYSGNKIDYSPNSKLDYSNKIDYEHINIFQQPHPIDSTTNLNGHSNIKRKSDDSSVNTTSSSSSENSAPSNSKKSDKKKGDPNGIKKKKTR